VYFDIDIFSKSMLETEYYGQLQTLHFQSKFIVELLVIQSLGYFIFFRKQKNKETLQIKLHFFQRYD